MHLIKPFHLIVCSFITAIVLNTWLKADPEITSWYTERSGVYARIYETDADQQANNSVTTWARGSGIQDHPTYAGIHEISYTTDWVYIRTTNLSSYVMGPWYLNSGRTNLFPHYPSNRAIIYRFPRNPVDPTTVTNKTLTGVGAIGYMVNGVSIFDSRDAISYSTATSDDENNGDGAWNRDAYVNEGVTFDAGQAHQARGVRHYHANPPALRHQLGDSVNYTLATNTYTESFNGKHSPIIGWMRDGLPVYGPYGYGDPMDSSSTVRRMISGYQLRTDIQANGSARNAWPAWASRIYGASGQAFSNGPNVSAAYPLGRYMEDNDYKGDLGLTLGTDFDLNEYNVRFCVTPEFPTGTWAYFTCIETDGTPVFPYNIGRAYFGSPSGSNSLTIPGVDDAAQPLVTVFEGGPEQDDEMDAPKVDDPNPNDVTLTWKAVEGGTYVVEQSTDVGKTDDWSEISTDMLADSDIGQFIHTLGSGALDKNFYRLNRKEIQYFDDHGFDYPDKPDAPAPVNGGPSNIDVSFDGGPEDLTALPVTLTFNGQVIDVATANVTRSSRRDMKFDVVTFGLAPGDYVVTAQYAAGPLRTGTFTVHHSVLLMIVDDWGVDQSPLDNTEPNVVLPKMPNLTNLASQGVRFTCAYAQPQCSPTRATILTGRQPYQHKVGVPDLAAQFSNLSGINEITIPEIITSEGLPHEMLTVGKWHLGGNTSAYQSAGGWPRFYGIQSGGVNSYTSWEKNANGVSANSTTYSTTDQVNHAASHIQTQNSKGKPHFTWVAFNAPHSPYEDPPATLAPAGGYSTQDASENDADWNYRKSLEALDTEIGRLLNSIDPAQTTVIIIGDNGTPGARIQAPFSNGHSKGSLYNGGIQVPMIVKGPTVTITAGQTSDKLVHCIDIFSTVLDILDIDESTVTGLPAMNVNSTSILPILTGTDTTDRAMVAEKDASPVGGDSGRAIIVDDYPQYKLIINGDPHSTTDTPTHELYKIDTDRDEQTKLAFDATQTNEINLTTLAGIDSGNALAAYNACLAVDAALGGGYNDPPAP